jgi:esterase/lipase superfamily enzyme
VGYPADEAAVEATVPHLISFLHELVEGAGAQRVHLVAHSMGNRALTSALRGFEKQRARGSFHQVILTAPDIDAQVFEEQIVPALRPQCARLTLYASSKDRALRASMQFHSYFRAGQSGHEILVLDGLDTIDASRVDTDLLGHGYFAENKAVIDDLFQLVRHSLPPPNAISGRD